MQAAQNELAGAEAGDGRDASNRSLQERLADAQNAQVGWLGSQNVWCKALLGVQRNRLGLHVDNCASGCELSCWTPGASLLAEPKLSKLHA